MKSFTLISAFSYFVLSLSSCEKEEDPIYQPLIGQFESSTTQGQVENEEYVTVYSFSKSGDLEIDLFIRNSETGNFLRYKSYYKGKFRATKSTISVEDYEFYHAPYSITADPITNKEELEKGNPGATSFEIQYQLRNSGNEFFIPGYMIGDDVLVPDLSFKRI